LERNKMCPDIISLGELLIEVMRTELNISHSTIGAYYRGPFPSGAPAIFIDSAARLGKPFKITTGFIGVVGHDDFGKAITSKLERDGVDISQIRVSTSNTTGIAFNQYNTDGSRKFIFAPGAAGETSPEDLNEGYFKEIKNLHITGSALSISESSRSTCYKAIKIAKEKNPNAMVSFDPNLRPEMLNLQSILEICKPILDGTDILFPSGDEVEMLTGIDNPKMACQELLKLGIKIIVLKQGKEGCQLFTPNDPDGKRLKGFKVDEIDPTGAGDSFGGAFMVGYLAGWDLEEIAKFANAAGALKVQVLGPMPDTSYDQVMRLIKNM
jgi:sugar/nucleoside kinase (ribokinase family)